MSVNPVMSVQKALKILDILIFNDINKNGFRLSELSSLTNIKPNTLHNILKTMIIQNYVRQTPEGNYIAGPQVSKIGLLNKVNSIKIGAMKQLEILSNVVQERIIFSMLISGKWNLIKDCQYESEIQINYNKVHESSIYQKATGRILVSFCSDTELAEIVDNNGYPGDNWDGITTIKELGTARKLLRNKGFVEMQTENNHLWVTGYPLLNSDGSLMGSIGCAAPAYRCDESKKEHIKSRLSEVAINIERTLK